MRILVTNDDGIDSPGIYALAFALRRVGTVTVVAPDRQQSAVGHALTVSSPLRATPFRRNGEMFGYAINGTPADCVKLAISTLLPEKPDIVVSGINHGANTSLNVLYSGTVSAATEAMMMGYKAMAVSLTDFGWEADMSAAADYAAMLAERLPGLALPHDTVLNVNVPAIPSTNIKGIKATRLSDSVWEDVYQERFDPMERPYYWLKGTYHARGEDDSDDRALADGWVAITPIRYDLNNYAAINTLSVLNGLQP
ncbi:5'/3'-nucleotidase SurE [Ignavibacteria bacterium]|nr:5'/3'-nucleotidase SurE [Bacteroidota bacterium]MCZ2133186.1 5'/3'-nucleotidase SurE [Bacteroidota bacterium]